MSNNTLFAYTKIRHYARIKLGLSLNEYCFLDFIYKCQTHPDYTADGWCDHSYNAVAKLLGLSKGTVMGMVRRTEKKGLFEMMGNGYKRTTKLFYRVAYLEQSEVEELEKKEGNSGFKSGQFPTEKRSVSDRAVSFRPKSGQFPTDSGQFPTEKRSVSDQQYKHNLNLNKLNSKQQQQSVAADYLQELFLDKEFLRLTSKNLGLDSELENIKNLGQKFFDFKKSVDELTHQDYAEFRKNFRFWLDKQNLEKFKAVTAKNGTVDYFKFNQGKSGIVKVGELGENREMSQLLDFDSGRKLLWYFLKNGQKKFSVTNSNKILLRQLTAYFSQTKDCELHRQHGVCLFGAKDVGKSDLMMAFKRFTKEMNQRMFKMAKCEKIVENLGIEKTITSLAKYYTGDWCFDGVGEEPTSFKLFGNPVEVMKKIFLERMRSNARTYMTTRLTPSQFREVYGDDVFEWLSGNMNFLVFQTAQ